MRSPLTSARRAVRRSSVVGLVVTLVLLIGGLGLALKQSEKWTAESDVVVLPSATLDPTNSAAYYETLSRGQIVATFAEVAGNLRFAQQAEIKLGLSAEQRQGVTTVVSVVPDTSVILVQATAATASVAEQVADATTSLASNYLAGLSNPYRTDTVHAAKGSAYSSGTSPTLIAFVALIVALVAGVGIQQAVYHIMSAARRDPSVATGEVGPEDEIASSDDVLTPIDRPAPNYRPSPAAKPAPAYQPNRLDLPVRRASRHVRYVSDRQEHADGNRRPLRAP